MLVDPTTLLAFVIASGAIVLSPGPDTILILRYTMSSGTRVGLATVAGVQLGLAAHTLLAILGITVIIVSSPILFKFVALAGAAYLAWLGIQSFRAGNVSIGLSAQGERIDAIAAAMIWTNVAK
jgi:homoserine/homoserine lactone efflux protein